MIPKLSVNINKIATLRNSRGGNNPDPIKVACDLELFGAQGITVHPRPDERHIRYSDVTTLAPLLNTEFNIEGNPREEKFVRLVLAVRPTQVTLVPDSTDQLTSDHGWNTIMEATYLKNIVSIFKQEGIRVSLFLDPVEDLVHAAANTGTDRIELYTEAYAKGYHSDPDAAIASYQRAAQAAEAAGLGVNAGHDLDLQNLKYFSDNIPNLLEVSIGHALVSDALYWGLENTVRMYRNCLS
jgi:pyridoxine 5-phosphate synthase